MQWSSCAVRDSPLRCAPMRAARASLRLRARPHASPALGRFVDTGANSQTARAAPACTARLRSCVTAAGMPAVQLCMAGDGGRAAVGALGLKRSVSAVGICSCNVDNLRRQRRCACTNMQPKIHTSGSAVGRVRMLPVGRRLDLASSIMNIARKGDSRISAACAPRGPHHRTVGTGQAVRHRPSAAVHVVLCACSSRHYASLAVRCM